MNRNYIWFLLGVAAGGFVGWQFAKRYFDKELSEKDEEIDSIIAYYKNNEEEEDKDVIFSVKEKIQDDLTKSIDQSAEAFKKMSNKARTALEEINEYSKMRAEERKEETEEDNKEVDYPYIISPEEFGEFDEYEQISLTYYADNVLVDENEEEVENSDEILGTDWPTHFGEYEDDSVFVRNDQLKCDYEILREERTCVEAFRERYGIK